MLKLLLKNRCAYRLIVILLVFIEINEYNVFFQDYERNYDF